MNAPRSLVPVHPDDIRPGTVLPWPLYSRARQLIAPAGFRVDSDDAHARLLHARPMREARPGDGADTGAFLRALREGDEDEPPPRPVTHRDPLENLRSPVEAVTLEFRLPGDTEPRRAHVTYVGRMPGTAVIVTAPTLGGSRGARDLEDAAVRVRMVTGRSIQSFESRVTRYAHVPSPHLYLAHPRSAGTTPFRAALRVPVDIRAELRSEGGDAIPGRIANLSASGCAVETAFLLGEPGSRFTVSFRLDVADKPHRMSLPSVLRNVQNRRGSSVAGLQFDPEFLAAQWSLPLLLRSFLLESTLDA
jgi:hypothetical protein